MARRIELTAGLKDILGFAAEQLKGSARRLFMAKTVKELGRGGQRLAEHALGWNRGTIRQGQHELGRNIVSLDAFHLRGRKKAEAHPPHLLEDIQKVVAPYRQTDPSFKTTRRYTRLTAQPVRLELEQLPVYRTIELPRVRTFDTQWNALDFRLRAVKKSQPLKKIPETDAIFAQVHAFHQIVSERAGVLRVSWDAQAPVKIGWFSRGGRSRVATAAWDHDFTPQTMLTPFNLFLPEYDENFLFFTASKVTRDFIVDTLERAWPRLRERFHPEGLRMDGDNGPEQQSHRTQCIKRRVDFAGMHPVNVRLIYDPPDHRKYNPVERTWAAWEHHWNGALLDGVDTVLRYAQTWTWKGKQAAVELIDGIYQTGVKLTQTAMAVYERRIKRFPGLERWFSRHPRLSWLTLGCLFLSISLKSAARAIADAPRFEGLARWAGIERDLIEGYIALARGDAEFARAIASQVAERTRNYPLYRQCAAQLNEALQRSASPSTFPRWLWVGK